MIRCFFMVRILEEESGSVKFSNEVDEFILDNKMQLKAVKLKSGQIMDHKSLHDRFSPKHPLLSTPKKVKHALDQFFVQEFKARRTSC
jgi:hypothetical protein